ncbi:hypothetical protein [Paenibacillus gansuensis]|uniref:Uncharacterized protein n=1 Tax=Paenibacillus gansuensis TaxID=306542 RepID=A0ABW5PII6_9BACL
MTLFVGLSEAAAMLEWDKHKLSIYLERGVFPKPFQQLESGPIWTVEQIKQYETSRDNGITIYYHDGRNVYRCFSDKPMELLGIEPEDIHNPEYQPMMCITEHRVGHLRRAMTNPDMVHFIGPLSVAAYYNFGLIMEYEYAAYLSLLEHSMAPNFNFAGNFGYSRKLGGSPIGSILEELEGKGIFQRDSLPADPKEAKKYIMEILKSVPAPEVEEGN